MIKVNLAKIAKRSRGTVARLRPISERVSAVKSYQRFLDGQLRDMARDVKTSVIPAFQADKKLKALFADSVVKDNDSWFERLRQKMAELERIAEDFIQGILELEAKKHTEEFKKSVDREFSIDLEAVIRQEDLKDYIDDAVRRNVGLIKSLQQDTFKRIEQRVYDAKIKGKSVTTLRRELQQDFGVSRRRAELIARDQMSKVTSDLNQRRQEQVGVKEYEWTTAHDERVRERHRELDGTRYKWGEETDAEQGLPPGQPINCRCVAIGVVKFD